tara:strand:- start:131 stop:352 length:222 start_codon:yes stop_codon:yes gene_type:complete
MTKPNINRFRHILKTLTWRTVGTIDTVLLGWFVTGDPAVGMTIGSLEVFTKMLLYYTHERVWYRLDFGIKRSE